MIAQSNLERVSNQLIVYTYSFVEDVYIFNGVDKGVNVLSDHEILSVYFEYKMLYDIV